MSYASMLLKLQIIRALEEDKNGFFFLVFNHEDQIPCKPIDLVSFFFVKNKKKKIFFLEEFLLNFLKRIGVDLKKIYFPRIELKDPKFN
jgi:hypothetical protein